MRKLLLLVLLGGCSTTGGQGPKGTPPARPSSPTKTLKLTIDRPPLAGGAKASPILSALEAEGERYMKRFASLKAPRPYFLGYQVTDCDTANVSASFGALTSSSRYRGRSLDVDIRVGNHAFDNTHPTRGRAGRRSAQLNWRIPIDDDPVKLRPTVWLATDAQYRRALDRYLRVRGNTNVKVAGDDRSDDFSREEPLRYHEAPATLELDRAAWERRIRAYSARFAGKPHVLSSGVRLNATVVNRFTSNSEGSAVQTSRTYVRLSFYAATRSKDGMSIDRVDSVNVGAADRLPDEAEIHRRIDKVIADVSALRDAPRAEPYVGPAIIEGYAAGVYFHEIFGHRVEGHRQKDDSEGQTFARKVGERVMPAFIDVYDDPTIRALNGVELRGFYRVDDEAVRAQRASLVNRGKLEGFLLSRAPTRGFARSNGHGRRQEGSAVVARQGNLIVHPRQVVTKAELKRRLLAEVAKQKKKYGLRFALTEGGYTTTGRWSPQAFKVRPVMVYRVYPDGREQLVRGVDIEGTPLTSLSLILAAADDMTVFNGTCGAESGWVPVSAASPSLLVGRVETASKAKGGSKPPLLPPPPMQKQKQKQGVRR